MLKKLEQLKQNRLAKNFLKLFSATLLAQVILISLSPVLTRLYTPTDFGVYGIYTSIVSLLIVYATGRYEFAIATSNTIEESNNLFKLVILLTVISSIFITFIIFFWEDVFMELLGIDPSEHTLYYIPVTILGLGIMQGINYLLNRNKNFTDISNAKVIQSMGNGGSSVGLAYMSFQSLGLIWANILGVFLSNVYNLFRKNLWRLLYFKKGDLVKIIAVAKKNKSFPLLNSTSAFFDVLALQAPVLVLSRFFSEAIVGFYSLTVRVIALPITLISSTVAQIYLSDLAEKENKGIPIEQNVKKVGKILALLGLIPVSILLFFGPALFEVTFGEEWRGAGDIARILVFAYYAKFVVSPLSVVFFVKNEIKILSVIQFTRAVTTVSILLIAVSLSDNIYIVLCIYTIYEILFYILYYYFILRICKREIMM